MSCKILMAARSPIYAPVYHAWTKLGKSVQDFVNIDFAKEKGNRDSLVSNTLSRYGGDNVLLAVGDVTRVLSFLDRDGYEPPVIVGGLIDKMCLWMLDQENAQNSPKITDPPVGPFEDRLILCHPSHMTTYQVASYYMSSATGGADVSKLLAPITYPGMERHHYRLWSLGARGRGRIAYMTTDLPEGNSSSLAVEFHKLPEFNSVAMTGLFTSERVYEKHKGLIDDIKGHIIDSIKSVYVDQEIVPYEIHCNAELMYKTGLKFDFDYLCRVRQTLEDMDAYSTNLAIQRDQLQTMLKIRLGCGHANLDNSVNQLLALFRDIPPAEVKVDRPGEAVQRLLLERESVRTRWIETREVVLKRDPKRSITKRNLVRWAYTLSMIGCVGLLYSTPTINFLGILNTFQFVVLLLIFPMIMFLFDTVLIVKERFSVGFGGAFLWLFAGFGFVMIFLNSSEMKPDVYANWIPEISFFFIALFLELLFRVPRESLLAYVDRLVGSIKAHAWAVATFLWHQKRWRWLGRS